VLPVPTTGLQNPASGSPLVLNQIVLGESANARPKVNSNTVSQEMLGRHGGGCYAVQTGLNLSIGATLHVTVAPGQAVIDGPRTIAVATDVTVPNTITNGTIWMTQAGALVASSTAASPGGNCCCLGFYTSAGGVVTAVDESGVLRLDQGLFPMRQCADTSVPTDTPPAGLRFLTKTPGGLWFWDGTLYSCVSGEGRAALTFSSDANKTLSANEGAARILDFLASGTSLGAQRDVIVPLTPRLFLVRNNSPGGQAIQVKGATGTGVVIATAKYALLGADSTNVFRVTPDT
jgi:hypothetical protein